MKPKSDEDVKKVWDKYWEMKQLLHDTYPANAYAVHSNGGLYVNWNIIRQSIGWDNLVRVKKEIIQLLKDNGLELTNYPAESEGIFRIKR